MQKRFVILSVGMVICLSLASSSGFAEVSAKDYYARGYAHDQQGDLPGAIADYTKAIELDPTYADAYYARGYVYSQTKNFKAAIADYTKELEINPKDGKIYYARASILDDQGDFAQAIEDYNKLIELNPQDASAYNSRGVAYGKQGDFVRALADYDKTIEMDPKFTRPYYNRGLAESLLGKDDEALIDYSRALDMEPRNADALNNRGISYTKKGNYEAAINDFTKAIELFPIETNPGHTPPYLSRAEAYIAYGRHDLAIKDCTKVINLYPGYVDAYRLRAKAYYYKKDTDHAWADVNTIRKLGKDVPIEFLMDLGRLTPVEDELEKAGLAVSLPEGWQLFMKANNVQKNLFGTLQVQSYLYVSADRKARILLVAPIAMSDGAYKKILDEIRSGGQGVLEEKKILSGVSYSVFTRIDQVEDRQKTVSYHCYQNGKAYAFAFSALEGEYGLYKSDFDKTVNGAELLLEPIDGSAFYIDQGESDTSAGTEPTKGKKGRSGAHHKKAK